jgi:hypothetical protein
VLAGALVRRQAASEATSLLRWSLGEEARRMFPTIVTRSRGFLLRGPRAALLRWKYSTGCKGIAMEVLGDLLGLLSKAKKNDRFSPEKPQMVPVMTNDDGRGDDD